MKNTEGTNPEHNSWSCFYTKDFVLTAHGSSPRPGGNQRAPQSPGSQDMKTLVYMFRRCSVCKLNLAYPCVSGTHASWCICLCTGRFSEAGLLD